MAHLVQSLKRILRTGASGQGSIWAAIMLGAVIFFASGVPWVRAQVQDERWTLPHRLSTVDGAVSVDSNSMVTDPYGNVHVFWIESGFPDRRSVIQHVRFDGKSWSIPIDVFVSEPGGTVESISSSIDSTGRIYLLWTLGNKGPVYFASAPANSAASAKQWQNRTRIDVPAYRARLLVDAKGTLHLLYSEFLSAEPGVYYVRSTDKGVTWSEPNWLDPDIPIDQAPAVIQFALDSTGGLHAVWHYIDLSSVSSIGTWVRYAHSLDGGDNWSLPFTIDIADESPTELRLPFPGLLVHGQTVHVIWAGDESTHREHRFSTDAGKTWSDTVRLPGDLVGQAIGDGLGIDAAGRLHLIAQIRWPQGLYHMVWSEGQWSFPQLFYMIANDDKDPIGDRIHAHNVRLAVRAGNQLVLTFTNSPGEADPLVLYAMERTLDDIAGLQPAPTPTPVAVMTAVADAPSATPVTDLAAVSSPTPTPMLALPSFVDDEPLSDLDLLVARFGMWLGILPVILLVTVTVLVQVLRKR
jgi:hypothetical protein